MICGNGVKLAAGQSMAARGFFSLFYQWSRTGCIKAQRDLKRSLHTQRISPEDAKFKWAKKNSVPYLPENRDPTTTCVSSEEQRDLDSALKLSDTLRKLMRSMPHSVVVLTTTEPNASYLENSIEQQDPPHSSRYRGMTLSSFTTLTLTPEPVVTFNIRKPSMTVDALRNNKFFYIHILSATPEGAAIADIFSKGNTGQNPFEKAEQELEKFAVREAQGEKAPMLVAKGVSQVLKCQLLFNTKTIRGLMDVGDHVLVLAKVARIMDPYVLRGGAGDGHGLCYADGRYREIGDIIEVKE